MAAWIKMPLGMELGLGPGDCVRWGPRSSPQKGVQSHKFSAHVYCVKTAGWIKMVLGVEIGLSPGDFVLDGDPAPLAKRGQSPPPQFSAQIYCGQTAGWIKVALAWRWTLVQATLC